MRWPWILIALLAAGVLIDRLMVAAERRDWVYWRRKPTGGSAAAAALAPLHALTQPSYEHVQEAKDREHVLVLRTDQAGPPPPGQPPPKRATGAVGTGAASRFVTPKPTPKPPGSAPAAPGTES